ncbi:hypothetical protein XcmpCFBP7700_07330 [Xanthomonas campestris]|nr:hypothetical protein XcmpCFBP7700_07330 [Xanthomonas campestris]
MHEIVTRKGGETEQAWTMPGLPGQAFGGSKPVYLLNSRQTFPRPKTLRMRCRRWRAPRWWARSPLAVRIQAAASRSATRLLRWCPTPG